MELKDIPLNPELTENNDRMKIFGNATGVWLCDKCGAKQSQFLYNYFYHITEICKECLEGKMIENVELREAGAKSPTLHDPNREANWWKSLTDHEKAGWLNTDKSPY